MLSRVLLTSILFCYLVTAHAYGHETGSLSEFVLGQCDECSYDNWVSHVVEGIARPGFNDYGPEFLDPQTNGFGHFTFVPSGIEGDDVLGAWRAVFEAAVLGLWSDVDTLLQARDSTWNYELVEFHDVGTGRDFMVVRERLDSSFIDLNVDSIAGDDVIGSFRNGWGLFVFNPVASNDQLVIQVVHPEDDFLAPPIALEMFLRMDAYLLMLAGAGREVMWDSAHAPYDNSKSLSDPSRNGRTPYQVCFEAVFDALDGGPLAPLITIQMHSYDTGTHGSLSDIQISAFADDQKPNPPLRDRAEHRDLIHFLGRDPLQGISGYPEITRRIDQYISLWSNPHYYFYDSSDSISIANINDLYGAGVNRQGQYSHVLHNADVHPENFIHVELDEYPDGLWLPAQWSTWLPGNMPATMSTYAPAIEYFSPFVAAMDSALAATFDAADTTTPTPVELTRVEYAGADSIRLYWSPAAIDRFFDSYMIYFDAFAPSPGSPSRNRTNSGMSSLAQFTTRTILVRNTGLPLETAQFAVGSRDLWDHFAPPSEPATVNGRVIAAAFDRTYIGPVEGGNIANLRWQISDDAHYVGSWRFTLPASVDMNWPFSSEPVNVLPSENAGQNLMTATAMRIGGEDSRLIEVSVIWNDSNSVGDSLRWIASIPVVGTSGATPGIHSTSDNDSAWFRSALDSMDHRFLIRPAAVIIDTAAPVVSIILNRSPECALQSSAELDALFSLEVLRGPTSANAPLESAWWECDGDSTRRLVLFDSVIAGDFVAPEFPTAVETDLLWSLLNEGCNEVVLAARDEVENQAISTPLMFVKDTTPPQLEIRFDQAQDYNDRAGTPQYGPSLLATDLDIDIGWQALDLPASCQAGAGCLEFGNSAGAWLCFPDYAYTRFPGDSDQVRLLWEWLVLRTADSLAGSERVVFVRVCDCAENCALDSFVIRIDLTAPENSLVHFNAAPSDLGVWLSWTWDFDSQDAVAMEIWRSELSFEYPRFEHRLWNDMGSAVSYPTDYPPAGWTRVVYQDGQTGTSASDFSEPNGKGIVAHAGDGDSYWRDADVSWSDELPARDVYRYISFVGDAAGNWSRATEYIPGVNVDFATNYWLGDFSRDVVPGPGPSAGIVDGPDLGLFAANYFSTSPPAEPTFDIGPVIPDAQFGVGRGVPVPDGIVNFYDLVVFSFTYGQVVPTGLSQPRNPNPVPRSSTDEFPELEIVRVDPDSALHDTINIAIRLTGCGTETTKTADGFVEWNPSELELLENGIPNITLQSGCLFAVSSQTALTSGRTGFAVSALGENAVMDGNAVLFQMSFHAVLGNGVQTQIRLVDSHIATGDASYAACEERILFISRAAALPDRIALHPNYPNPFNSETHFKFDLARESDVEIMIFNTLGQMVARILDSRLGAGSYHGAWNGRSAEGRDAASGVYICRMRAGTVRLYGKMVLIR